MPNYPYSFQLPPLSTQDIPNNGAVGEFLGISAGGVLDWLPVSAGAGDMLKSENLIGLGSYPTARTNLGLGTTDTPTFKNLVISTGSIATSAPVTISQTWSTTGTYTAAKIDVTETATAAAASLLLDLQIGGARRLSVRKNGLTYIAGTLVTPNGLSITSSEDGGNQTASFTTDGVRIPSQSVIGFTSASSGFGTLDTILLRDGAANTLALRNGAAAQTFNVYGTYSTSPSLAYSRLAIACDTSGNATLTTQSTGTAGTVSINGVPVGLGKGSISSNVAVGTGPLIANTTGSHNSILGFQALQTNTSGGYNVAMGYQALYLNTTGVVNSALGAGALSSNTSGQYNLASGVNSLQSNTTGTYNSALGPQALQTNTTGSYNTAAGYNAGTYIANGTSANQTSSNSLFLGTNSKALGVGQDNQIVIGYDATGLGSNTAVLGNSSITTTALRGNVGIGTTAPSSKLHVALNPATNYTTEKVQFGNSFFGNGVSGYSFMWMGSISTPLTLSNLNYVLASDGSGTILNSPSTSGITFQVGGSNRWSLPNTGHLLAATDNSYDIGASGANRPRNVYVANNVTVGNTLSVAICDVTAIRLASNGTGSVIRQDSNGIIRLSNNNETDFNRLQFGGAADTAPAIARDGAGIKFTGAAAGLTSWIKVPAVAVLSLPAAATAGVGARAFVNDALAPVFGNTVATGGAVAVPVYSDGAAWKVG